VGIFQTDINPGLNLGNNAFGQSGWDANAPLKILHTANASGISEAMGINQSKYGTGDNIPVYCYAFGEGGRVDPSGEGTKCMAANTQEDFQAYTGYVTGGPHTNPTSISTTAVVQGGSEGVGRMLIYRGQCGTNGSTYLSGGCPAAPYTGTVSGIATVSGLSQITVSGTVPVSNAWGTLNANCNTGNTTPPASTSASCAITVVNGAFDTTHLLCFASNFHDCSYPTAVSLSAGVATLTIPLRHQHAAGSQVFQGGMAGYGMEFSAFTQTASNQPLRLVYDVFGSTSANTIQVGRFVTGSVVAIQQTSAIYQFFNLATTLSSSGPSVTGTYVAAGSTLAPAGLGGATFIVANADDEALNGACTGATWTSATEFTCTHAGLTGTHTDTSATPTAMLANAAGVQQNAYNLWPIAEVIDVRNNSVNPPVVDGTLALEPNIFGTVSNGDIVEETHGISALFVGNTNNVWFYNPYGQTGITGGTLAGAGAQGGGGSVGSNAVMKYAIAAPDSTYAGGGGLLTAINALNFAGPYGIGLDFDHAPYGGSFTYIQSYPTQYNNPNFNFNLFRVDGKSSTFFNINPNTSATISQTGGPAQWIATNHAFTGPIIATSNITGRLMQVSSLSNSGTTVSAAYASGYYQGQTGSSFQIAGASDPAFNKACFGVIWTDTTHFTCTISNLSGVHTAATAQVTLMNDVSDTNLSGNNTLGTASTTQTIHGTANFDGTVNLPAKAGLTPGAYTSANVTVAADGTVTAIANGTGGSGTPAATPAWLKYLGNGGAGNNFNCTSGTCTVYGDYYVGTFNVGAGATVNVTASAGLTIHATGACTINGTIDARGITQTGNGNGLGASGSGGGGGGGTAAGTAGKLVTPGTNFSVAGGTAGATSGGNGGNGNSQANIWNSTGAHVGLLSAGGNHGQFQTGGAGGAGGSSGGTAGNSGGSVVLICASITGTGTIDVSGSYGSPSVGNNTGAGGGGGGGMIILSSQAAETYTLNTYVAGGPGSLAGTVGYPEAVWTGGTATSPAKALLGATAGALNGTCTVQQAGAGYGTGAGTTAYILGGGGTQGTATVNATWSDGSLQSCTVTPGTSSGYTAGTYTGSGAGGDGGNGIAYQFSGW